MKLPNVIPFLLILIPLSAVTLLAWQPAENTMLSRWAKEVTPENAWQEYPRPQMVRESWTNLNGLWDYAITPAEASEPEEWTEQILVPYVLESPLSGIGKRLEEGEVIWYRKTFDATALDERMLLNFEGVDYECRVWLNGKYVGSHRGGNLPFSFEVTDQLQEGLNELILRIIDYTDNVDKYQLRGKQRRDNTGIWYTPSTGIWQTVWLEPVPNTYIERIKLTADMHGKLRVEVEPEGYMTGREKLHVSVLNDGKVITEKTVKSDVAQLWIAEPKLWSPKEPNLYDLKITLLDPRGNTLDAVESYTGFRTVGRKVDDAGNWRFTINGEYSFQHGPLDQGWWPGSFLNPPSDEAIVFEMQFLKDAGFNLIRKHKKVDPRRYYYHADRIGLLIWQDHVSGGAGPNEWPKWKRFRAELPGYEPRNERHWAPGDPLEADWPDWAHEQFMTELKTMIDMLYNNPSVIVWTTFNERWGQHRSLEIGAWVEAYDPTRLLNIASGGNFFPIGDIADEHRYPRPVFPLEVEKFDPYVKVMGEFGGHGFPIEGHLWDPNMRNWGYGGLPESLEEYQARYVETAQMLGELRKQGISAGVYTQTTDVEGELNGIMTYDREVFKMSAETLYQIHKEAGLLE